MDSGPTLMDHILSQQPWLIAWVFWMIVLNSASLLFAIWRVEARWVLAAWIVNAFLMDFLYQTFGFERVLGLSHIVLWTPLLVYLIRRWPGFDRASAYGLWLTTLTVTNGLSLAIDYVDLARWLMGDGALPQ